MRKRLVFGNKWVEVDLPERTRVVSPGGLTLPVAPVPDLTRAVREALDAPLGLPPLRELVRPGATVTIAFDDPTVPCFAPVWSTAISAILEDLERAGVRREAVSLVCANGLHRQFRHEELAQILGPALVESFARRLSSHDAEDPDGVSFLGRTPSGREVELNRRVVDSDLTIYVNTACTRAFNGGWKSVCVGLSTWRSIRWHHTPDVMSMSMERNRMHEMLDEMGVLVEQVLGPGRIFKVETVLSNPFQVGRIWAGTVDATRHEVLALMREHVTSRRDLLEERADVVLYGIPEWSPYAAFSVMNPILTLSSTGLGYLGGVIEALGKPGCTVILATPCPNCWDDVSHPSYREVFDRVLPDTRDPYEVMERYEEEFAHRPDYIEKYRHGFGFHPLHGLMALHPLKRLRHAGQVIVAGIEDRGIAERFGFLPAATVEEALAVAEGIQGAGASIACVEYPMAMNRQ